jgi:hypothetical protein
MSQLCNSDFDYIQDGGFLIQCQGGDVLGVTGDQAAAMTTKNGNDNDDEEDDSCGRGGGDYFRNCFRHGTTESTSRILVKPDWPIAIARHLVEVLTKGKTTVSHLTLLEELIKAADQACIDLRLCSMVNYLDPTEEDGTRNFFSLVDPTKYRFQLNGRVTSAQWLKLLSYGILLYRKETNFVVTLGGSGDGGRVDGIRPSDHLHQRRPLEVDLRSHTMARRKLDTRTSDYVVHTNQTIQALLQISQVLSNSNSPAGTSTTSANGGGELARASSSLSVSSPNHHPRLAILERYSIYFETKEPLTQVHNELIDRLAGGEAYIRTCADASVKSEGYTVLGSFDVLRRALQPLLHADNTPCCSPSIPGDGGVVSSSSSFIPEGRQPDPHSQVDQVSAFGASSYTGTTSAAGTSPHRPSSSSSSSASASASTSLYCSLRIDHPTPDTLGRFINACQTAKDYPGSLGLDASSNRYFCRKSIRDVVIILDYLADYSTKSDISGEFQLYERSSEDIPF